MPIPGPGPREGGADPGRSPTSPGADPAPVARNDGYRQALIDPAVLIELAEHLQSPYLAHRFARDYAALWEQRHRRLTIAVEGQDHAAALDAAISLKTSSAMVGGKHLAGLAGKLQALLPVVADSGRATVNELNLSLP